jgi:hypothetical protein
MSDTAHDHWAMAAVLIVLILSFTSCTTYVRSTNMKDCSIEAKP